MLQALTWAAAGTGFTALMTAAGAAVVFLFRKKNSQTIHRVMLGFAAGVMIAASMWSLLIPAIEKAEELGQTGWLLGDLGNPIAGALETAIFTCPKCGKLEFFRGDFFDGEGEEAGSIAETRCPSCGVRYEMDYPKCPRCGEANPNW